MRPRVMFFVVAAVVAAMIFGSSAMAAEEEKPPASPAPAAPDRSCSLKSSAHRSPNDEWLSCFNVSAELSGAPKAGQTAELRVKVRADKRRDDADVSIELPDNMTFDESPSAMRVNRGRSHDGTSPGVQRASGKNDFAAGQSRTYTAKVKASGPGTGQIHARVNAAGEMPGSVDSGSDDVFVTIAEPGGTSKFGIDTPGQLDAAPRAVTGAPASAPAAPGRSRPVPAGEPPARTPDEPGSTIAGAPSAPGAVAGAPGSSCVTGAWKYQDQTGAVRGAANTVIEAWDFDSFSGDDFLGSVFADWQGGYTICFGNDDGDPGSGSTQEVYVKFVSSNSRWRMEPVLSFQVGTPTVADNTTHDFGTLFPADPAFDRGLHAYDEANDAWNWTPGTTCWDQNETSGCSQLIINWGPSSVDGTYYDLANGIHLAADDPNSQMTTVHEVGHFLMHDLYDGYYPPFPNCNPHSVFGPSSTGCAFTEGWAEWLPAAVYNDPNYRWPDGGVQPLETPTWGYTTPGDTLEGWVAAALIDIADTTNEGPWDRFSEGGLWNPGNIYAESANDGFHPSTFAEFWNRRGALGHDVAATGALASIYQSTIDYGFRDPLGDYAELTRPTPTPHNYSYNTNTIYWSAAAVRPPAGVDYDMTLYDDFNQTAALGASTFGGNTVDFVAVDSNDRPFGDYYPRVYQYSGSGNYQVELAQGASSVTGGTASIFMGANDVVAVRDSFGTAGQAKHVRVVPTGGGQDPEVFLMASTGDPATQVRSRGLAAASSTGAGPGGVEQFVYTPSVSDWYGLVLTNRAGSGNYNLYVDQSAPTGSVAIAGGAAYTSFPNVNLTLSADDAETGIDGMQISVDGTLDTEPYQAFQANKAVTLPSGDGVKTALVRYKNRAGMESATFSDTILLDSRPDLAAISVSNPPLTGIRGSTFSVTDTVRNNGATGSGVTTAAGYYLSANGVFDAGDVRLNPGRSVPSLASLATSTGTVTVTIPPTMPGGGFRLLACADANLAVAEAGETNNCRASSTTIAVQVPDLRVKTISNPPASAAKGSSFNVTDTTRNSGNAPAGASATRFFLSLDAVYDAADVLLATKRNVPALAAGDVSTGTVAEVVPGSIASGTYRLIACADHSNLVAEGDELNNCLTSATSVIVS